MQVHVRNQSSESKKVSKLNREQAASEAKERRASLLSKRRKEDAETEMKAEGTVEPKQVSEPENTAADRPPKTARVAADIDPFSIESSEELKESETAEPASKSSEAGDSEPSNGNSEPDSESSAVGKSAPSLKDLAEGKTDEPVKSTEQAEEQAKETGAVRHRESLKFGGSKAKKSLIPDEDGEVDESKCKRGKPRKERAVEAKAVKEKPSCVKAKSVKEQEILDELEEEVDEDVENPISDKLTVSFALCSVVLPALFAVIGFFVSDAFRVILLAKGG